MMYFSQLVSTMRNPTIAVAVVEDGGAIQYTGELFDLPFCRFREWHDFKVVDVMPMYDEEKKEPYLVIEIDYAGGKKWERKANSK